MHLLGIGLAPEKPRFGYRTLHVLLRRKEETLNHKRVQRNWRCGPHLNYVPSVEDWFCCVSPDLLVSGWFDGVEAGVKSFVSLFVAERLVSSLSFWSHCCALFQTFSLKNSTD